MNVQKKLVKMKHIASKRFIFCTREGGTREHSSAFLPWSYSRLVLNSIQRLFRLPFQPFDVEISTRLPDRFIASLHLPSLCSSSGLGFVRN